MNSLERMLAVLDLFTDERTIVTAEEVTTELDISRATAYRYLMTLTKAGLLAPGAESSFALGARIVDLERLIRMSDPLLVIGEEEMEKVKGRLKGALLLCSFYGDKVLCIHRVTTDPEVTSSYMRGKPMPLLRGATSKVILAHLPPYQQRNLMLNRGEDIRAAGLGKDWDEFRNNLRQIRQAGYVVAQGEIDKGMAGIAVPLFRGKAVLGSLSLVMTETQLQKSGASHVAKVLGKAADTVSSRITELSGGADGKQAIRSPRHLSLIVKS